jgi:hypothetical protein
MAIVEWTFHRAICMMVIPIAECKLEKRYRSSVMALREHLTRMLGVWRGEYVHMRPDGEVMDRHESRQEARLEGDRWYERVVYRWPDGREEVHDFRGRLEGNDLILDDPDFHGETFVVVDGLFVFPYHWKDRPDQRIVETIVFAGEQRRSRVWQTIEDGQLARVTAITETFAPDEEPACWD